MSRPWEGESFRAAEKDYLGGIDIHTPHSARVWNRWMGGKDNFPADRRAADAYARAFPEIISIARCSRMALARAVGHLAREEGIRQFLDLGVGLPSPAGDDVHQIAQRIAPQARIVYTDHDLFVLAHARGLLNTLTRQGAVTHLNADLRDPAPLLRAAAGTLDTTRPIAVLCSWTLCHITDDEHARTILTHLARALPAGGFLTLVEGVTAIPPQLAQAHADHTHRTPDEPWVLREPARLARLLDGLDLLPPGLTAASAWRPELAALGPAPAVEPLIALARIPARTPLPAGATR